MAMQLYDYVQPKDVKGKIFLTCFPGRNGEKISFEENIFLEELNNFSSLNSNTVVTLVEDNEIEKLCDKKFFVRKIYSHNLKWIHMPIVDLKSPDHKFMDKWQTTKEGIYTTPLINLGFKSYYFFSANSKIFFYKTPFS